MHIAELGSAPAAALLDYMSLRGVPFKLAEATTVSKLCRDAAIRGDGYAQYVVAWREYDEKNYEKAAHWLNASMRQLFPPAVGDFAQVAIRGTGMSRRRPDLARRSLYHAIRLGHLPSLLYLVQFAKKGAFGAAWRPFGWLSYPVVLLYVTTAMHLRPFDWALFTYVVGGSQPLFVNMPARNSQP
jgi:TPR repeat protein